MVNGHKYAAHTDSPDGATGKTCRGGGMQCTVSVFLVNDRLISYSSEFGDNKCKHYEKLN